MSKKENQSSEHQVDIILEALPVCIIVSQVADGKIVYVNSQTAQLFGKSAQELIGRQTPDFYVNPADRQQLLAAIQRDKRVSNYEMHLKKGDGTPFWAAISAEMIDFKGTPCLLVGLMDISARKQAEEALSKSDKNYRQLYNLFSDGLVSVNMDGYITECNPAFEKMVGYSLAELRQIRFPDLTPPQWHAMENKILADQALTRGYTDFYQKEYIHKNGTIFPVELAVYTQNDDQGNVIGFWGFIRDISARKRVETESERRRLMLQAVLDNVPMGIFMIDAAGKTMLANKSAQAMLGRGISPDATPEELGQVYNAYRYGSPELYPTAQMPLVRGLSGEAAHVDDMEIHRPDGSTLLLEVFGVPITNAQGQITASLAIFQDITERKQTEFERAHLQAEIIEAQQHALKELSTPIIPIMDRIIVMPLIGSIDTMRAKDITRALLRGISEYRAKIVILDITGVPIVDSGVANHLNKTIQAARLKGARTIVTGVSDAVAETIVDLGIDWSAIETLRDLQTGLVAALNSLGIKLSQ
jgi:PAS domain S-box-containing protein